MSRSPHSSAPPPHRPTTRRARRPRVLGLAGIAVGILTAVAALGGARIDQARSGDPLVATVASTALSTALPPGSNPYLGDELEAYRRFFRASRTDDLAALTETARGDDYLAYRAARTLARHVDADPATRLEAYRRVFDLRIDDPLARAETRRLRLELARTAEAAGDVAAALEAYREALPDAEAVGGIERLEPDPYRRANAYLQGRLYRRALDALGDLRAPSIEAPAHRRLGEHEAALAAYQRWLDEIPGSPEARYGVAWSHWYLGDLDAAERAFRALPGSSALYGRALVANRRGDLDEAVRLLAATGEAGRLWLATELLERAGRPGDALPLYLQLAAGGSAYADDAAYRAWVLARRLGRPEAGTAAEALIPEGSFFALRLGGELDVPSSSELPAAAPPVLALASALMAANDLEAATGELEFALREARAAGDVAAIVPIAEMLASLGAYRPAQRAGAALLAGGSDDLRVWRLAYPQAYPDAVRREAAARGLEPELVWAIMRQESAFYPAAVSRSNAIGLMQVIPSTWNWLAELQDEAPGDPFDPETNIRYGAFYLGWLFDYLDGDPELVIPSYNRGQGYIKRLYEGPDVAGDKDELYRDIDAFETREYLQRVVVNLRVYRALYGAGETAASASGPPPETAEAR